MFILSFKNPTFPYSLKHVAEHVIYNQVNDHLLIITSSHHREILKAFFERPKVSRKSLNIETNNFRTLYLYISI